MAFTKVLIVEDDAIIAEDIKEMLSNASYSVIDIAYTKNDAINILSEKNLDLVLLDINLNGQFEGIEIAQFINETKRVPFLYITSYSGKEILEKAKKTLPLGYIVKPFNEAELYSSIEIALHNFSQFHIPITLTRESINKLLINPVTQKEFDILKGLYDGKNNQQLADENFVSLNTIKTHLKNIFEKMNTNSRTETIAKLNEILHH